jgi:hypothetical protein
MKHLSNGTRRRRQSPRRHFRNGHRAAVMRPTTGARLYLDGRASSLTAAAEACGSCVQYVQAAITLLKADDPTLLQMAIAGWISLTEAANQERLRRKAEPITVDEAVAPVGVTVDEAVASWRTWTLEQRAQFGRSAGVGDLWDHAISPVITENRASQVQAAE